MPVADDFSPMLIRFVRGFPSTRKAPHVTKTAVKARKEKANDTATKLEQHTLGGHLRGATFGSLDSKFFFAHFLYFAYQIEYKVLRFDIRLANVYETDPRCASMNISSPVNAARHPASPQYQTHTNCATYGSN